MSVFRQLMMRNKKETFSNELDYNKTLFLCHFDNDITNLGNTSFSYSDGYYIFNSDAKFGSYSIGNYQNNLVWNNSGVNYYNTTLEFWAKPINVNYELVFGYTSSSWANTVAALQKSANRFFDSSAGLLYFDTDLFEYNKWNHVALTFEIVDNMLQMVLWINGNFCASRKINVPAAKQRFYLIGRNSSQGSVYTLIDECVLHNYVRYRKPFNLQTQAYIITGA